LQSIVSLSELIDEEIRNETLKTFVFVDPRSEDWPSWKRWDTLMTNAEPEDDHPIFEYLNNKIIKPIKSDPQNLPSPKSETVSVLFFGPPGTSKTTLVHAIADGLGWPIVMLSPGDFIEKGLEYIEAQARTVFDRLQKLRRAVVLFDECDELFRNRRPSNESEQMRNITAFVTASMLPKLQDLHDRGRVVFCICTNKFDTLDPAIKRGGRIDHIIAVGPPQRRYRQRTVEGEFRSISDSLGKTVAIAELVNNTDGFVRREILRTCEVVLSNVVDWMDTTAVTNTVSEAVNRIRQSLMITPDEYRDFQEEQRQFSHPVI
jgi:SpoVK/Ycf46/Vps4 family AAA+-type ATPase